MIGPFGIIPAGPVASGPEPVALLGITGITVGEYGSGDPRGYSDSAGYGAIVPGTVSSTLQLFNGYASGQADFRLYSTEKVDDLDSIWVDLPLFGDPFEMPWAESFGRYRITSGSGLYTFFGSHLTETLSLTIWDIEP